MRTFQPDVYKNITVKIEPDSDVEDPFEGNSILAGLILYDPELAKKDLEEQMKHTLILTKDEFSDAADKGIFIAFVAFFVLLFITCLQCIWYYYFFKYLIIIA